MATLPPQGVLNESSSDPVDRASIGLGEEFQGDRRSRSASLSFAVDWASDRGYAQRIANVNEEKSPTQVTNIGMLQSCF